MYLLMGRKKEGIEILEAPPLCITKQYHDRIQQHTCNVQFSHNDTYISVKLSSPTRELTAMHHLEYTKLDLINA